MFSFLYYCICWLMIWQYMEDGQLADLLQELLNLASSPAWAARHGSVLVFATFLRHNPSAISMSPLFLSILDRLKSSLKDEKVLSFWENYASFGNTFFFGSANSDTSSQIVSSSWSFNQGFRKASASSNSKWSCQHHSSCWYSCLCGVCLAWWFQWS